MILNSNQSVMRSNSSKARFLYSTSEQSADLLYLTGVYVPDAFLAGMIRGKSFAVVNRLEFGRVLKQSNLDSVLLLEAELKAASEAFGIAPKNIGPAELIAYYLKKNRLRTAEVPSDFPASYYARLLKLNIKVELGDTPFFAERSIKTEVEAEAIRKGNAASAAGIRAAEAVLKKAVISGKRLMYDGRALTSERLRTVIDQTCLENGAIAQHTIVAGGAQACDPHEAGHGVLRPNELIIIDCFPRVQATGFHGDMTRTFLKGRASEAQRNLVNAVRAAQQSALKKVRSRVTGNAVHQAAAEVFEKRGFKTERKGDTFTGFIHSTGHGLGLEVHESPRVSVNAPALKAGQVITIEPGLYYPGLGGCRIEDVVQVTAKGSNLLSSMHYRWEIR